MSFSQKLRSTFRLLFDWKLLAYNLLIVVYSSRIVGRKIGRFLADRKRSVLHHLDPGRWFCPVFHPQKRTGAPHVVFIGIGWGEMRVVELLTTTLKERRPDIDVTWSFRDRDAIKTVLEEKPNQAVTFMPFDFSPPVWNWLRRLCPDVVVSAEKVWLPNIMAGAKAWGAITVVSGGRVSRFKQSFLSGGAYRIIHRWTASNYDTICLQGEADFKAIGSRLPPDADVRVTGAIKLSHSKRQRAEGSPELEAWMREARGLPILAAGSTVEDEEVLVLDAFDLVRAQVPCALLLAPRRMFRLDEVNDLLESRAYNFTRRSRFSAEGKNESETATEVFFLDTVGELAAAFQWTQAAYVGGTLRGRGHNVIEPLEWGVPVFFGPGNGLVVAPQVLCEDAGVGFKIRTAQELADHWLAILRDENLREDYKTRAAGVIEQQCRALEDNVAALVEAVDAAQAKINVRAKFNTNAAS